MVKNVNNQGANIAALYNHTTPVTPDQQDKRGLFSRILGYFSSKTSEQTPCLTGRVQEIRQVLQKLTEVKATLLDKLQPELHPRVSEAIDPMLREIQKLGNSKLEGRVIEKYDQWILKAKKWIRLYEKSGEKRALQDLVVRFVQDSACDQLERDIKFLQSYATQQIANTDATDKDEVIQVIYDSVQPHINGLKKLQKRATTVTLDTLPHWKHKRSSLVNRILQDVDRILSNLEPA